MGQGGRELVPVSLPSHEPHLPVVHQIYQHGSNDREMVLLPFHISWSKMTDNRKQRYRCNMRADQLCDYQPPVAICEEQQ
ncbi:jg11110 [Pararge aegeria aegeria]|uniref:Jg11110 protein n=1 Tax=Pararge aegeria aegeria TaxID=348720 RepID=A0A8S4SC03_9NEOP|nr:jg11110 [Pararge aegeria aegeria]